MRRRNAKAWPIPMASSAPAANSAARRMRSGRSRWLTSSRHGRPPSRAIHRLILACPMAGAWSSPAMTIAGLGGRFGDHFPQELSHASSSLSAQIFVRPVRLIDRAGAADHRRNAVSLEMSGFGAIGHRLRPGWRRSVRAPAGRRANPRPSPGRDTGRAVSVCECGFRRRGAGISAGLRPRRGS